MASQLRARQPLARQPLTQMEPERVARPVKWWAALGAGFLVLGLYEWISWVVAGHVQATPRGSTVLPPWQTWAVRTTELATLAVALVIAYRFLYRPWRREGRLTPDGMLLIAVVSMWAIQDPWTNYTRTWFNYNSAFFNLGCPQCHVPGWQAPNGHLMAEPLLFAPSVYVIIFGQIIACNWLMRRAKQRWPRLGKLGLCFVAFSVFAGIDAVGEIAAIRLGLAHMGGAPRWFSFFPGHYYQYPITEAVFFGGLLAAIACVRYFVDDRGHSLADRGIDQGEMTRGRRTALRLLAITGLCNGLFLLIYNIPTQWVATHADNFPADVLDKSYLTNLMCGPGTDYACAGPRIPIPVGDSGHVAPDGTFVGGGGPLQQPDGLTGKED